MTLAETFDLIYEKNAWGGRESLSGPGAGTEGTRAIIGSITSVVSRYNIGSVLDVGCGDGFWMPDLPGYIGVDVSSRALNLARERHPDRDYRLDEGGPYPTCDLAIVRCVFQHLSYADTDDVLRRLREAGVTWLLATTYEGGGNTNITSGSGYWNVLSAPPFNLGEPIELYPDPGANPTTGRLGLWRL